MPNENHQWKNSDKIMVLIQFEVMCIVYYYFLKLISVMNFYVVLSISG